MSSWGPVGSGGLKNINDDEKKQSDKHKKNYTKTRRSRPTSFRI